MTAASCSTSSNETESFPWTVDELGREMNDPITAHDAVGRLVSAGLPPRVGEFVFPKRAGRRAHELQIGTAWLPLAAHSRARFGIHPARLIQC